jgi:hypothetical protein
MTVGVADRFAVFNYITVAVSLATGPFIMPALLWAMVSCKGMLGRRSDRPAATQVSLRLWRPRLLLTAITR